MFKWFMRKNKSTVYHHEPHWERTGEDGWFVEKRAGDYVLEVMKTKLVDLNSADGDTKWVSKYTYTSGNFSRVRKVLDRDE